MKITVKKEISEEIEIQLPAYFKTSISWIHVLSEDVGLWVTQATFMSIEERKNPMYYHNDDWRPSTPEEFNAALEAAINHINELNR